MVAVIAKAAWPLTGISTAVVVASLGFRDTVSLGSVISAAALIVAAGIFTLRQNVKSFWRDLAEQREQQIEQLRQDADAALQERAKFAEEQRDIRHQLKNDLAAATANLTVERARHDLTTVYERLDVLERLLERRQDVFETLLDHARRQTVLLTELRDALIPSTPE